MAADREPVGSADILKLRFCLEPIEVDAPAALCAGEQVLMPIGAAKNGLTSAKVMDAVNEVEVFQNLDRSINGHQSQPGFGPARQIKYLQGGEGVVAFGYDLQDRTAGTGQAAAGLPDVLFPFFLKDAGVCFFHAY